MHKKTCGPPEADRMLKHFKWLVTNQLIELAELPELQLELLLGPRQERQPLGLLLELLQDQPELLLGRSRPDQ